jgi:hypothetical protein
MSKNESGTAFDNFTVVAMRLVGLIHQQENGAFNTLRACKTITVDATSTRYHHNFFATAAVKHFNFPRLFSLDSMAFNSSYLRSVVLAQGMTQVPGLGFANTLLTEIILPDTIVTIGDRSFVETVRSLKEIVIPASVTTIYAGAFAIGASYQGLRKLVMKPTVPPTIYLTVGNTTASTFAFNGTLKEIIVPAGCGEAYKSATNWSYYADIIKEEEI